MADQKSSERQKRATDAETSESSRVGRVGGGRHRHRDDQTREPREAQETAGRPGGGRHGR